MSRRRYLSTTISTDKAVNRLAMQYGDFAALLYTWLIPHAADDCAFPADPEELLMIVMPGRRDKEPADIQAALDAMLTEGLILRDPENRNALMFPPKSFYGHQTYIKEERQRKTPQNGAHPENAGDMPQTSASRAPAPSSVSSSVSDSHSVRGNDSSSDADAPTAEIGPVFGDDSPEYELAVHLADRKLENNPKSKPTSEKQLQNWANDVRLMVQRDERSLADIRTLIDWSQADSFWRANILSMGKLREKYDQLWLRMTTPVPARASPRRGGARNGELNGNDWARIIQEEEARERARSEKTDDGHRGHLAELPAW